MMSMSNDYRSPDEVYIDELEERIATLETENAALRQQVAALQAAQPVRIEWKEHRTRYSFDDLIAEALDAASNVSGDVVGEE